MVEETLPNKPSQMLKIDSKLRIFMRCQNHGWRIFFKSRSLICSKLTVELRFFFDIFTAAKENFQIHISQVLKIDSWINTFSTDIFTMVEENLPIKPSQMLKNDSKLRIFMWYLQENLPIKPSQMLKTNSKLRIFMWYLHHGWRKFFKSSSPKCSRLTLELIFSTDIFTLVEENLPIKPSQMLKMDS